MRYCSEYHRKSTKLVEQNDVFLEFTLNGTVRVRAETDEVVEFENLDDEVENFVLGFEVGEKWLVTHVDPESAAYEYGLRAEYILVEIRESQGKIQ